MVCMFEQLPVIVGGMLYYLIAAKSATSNKLQQKNLIICTIHTYDNPLFFTFIQSYIFVNNNILQTTVDNQLLLQIVEYSSKHASSQDNFHCRFSDCSTRVYVVQLHHICIRIYCFCCTLRRDIYSLALIKIATWW